MGSSHGAVKGLPPAFWRLEGCPLPSSWRPQGPLRCHPPPAREACCLWALRISNFGGCSLATFLAPCVKRRLRQPSTSGQANPESQDEPRLPVTFTEYQAQLSPDGTCFPPARRVLSRESVGKDPGGRRHARRPACAGGVGGALSRHAGGRLRREAVPSGGLHGEAPHLPQPRRCTVLSPRLCTEAPGPGESGSRTRPGRRLLAGAAVSLPDTHARRQPEGRITDASTS